MTSWVSMRRPLRRRRRWQGLVQLTVLTFGVFTLVGFCLLVQQKPNNNGVSSSTPSAAAGLSIGSRRRSLLQETPETDPSEDQPPSTLVPLTNSTNSTTKAASDDALFPPNLFTDEQLRQGAIVLYVIGMIYMFVALAIVCDEFFVPALDVIIEKLQISEDVAGATFMAAGGSAPELFTSVIGVFISFNDVGIGTIVGSAVFNILFVIAMCVLFSKTVLDLTWWPIFRDVTFYSIALIMLVLFFLDGNIYWYEALLMFFVYLLYCGFMKVNETFEKFVKKHLNKNKHAAAPSLPTAAGRRQSVPVLHSGTKFRQGLLQLMIHTIDPLHDEGKVDDKATQLHAIASLKVLLDATKPQNGRVETYRSDGGLSPDQQQQPGVPNPAHSSGGRSSQGTEVTQMESSDTTSVQGISCPGGVPGTGGPTTNGDLAGDTYPNNVSYPSRAIRRISYKAAQNQENLLSIPEIDNEALSNNGVSTSEGGDDDDEDDDTKPIDLSWPETPRKRFTYLLVAPLIFPLWLTLPDTRTPRGKRYFFVTFLGSIIWIAIFSYLMVWWATIVGDTINIPAEVMGLTVLAAGTSVPDLITSVIVARKGFGDMAVSSSIGSNIFDVCVGLPVPWLLFALGKLVSNFINKVDDPWTVAPIAVQSGGMACSIMLLFSMLMFVLISIMCSRWRMNKGLGCSMFVLYFIFVAVSLSFEYDKISCPI